MFITNLYHKASYNSIKHITPTQHRYIHRTLLRYLKTFKNHNTVHECLDKNIKKVFNTTCEQINKHISKFQLKTN